MVLLHGYVPVTVVIEKRCEGDITNLQSMIALTVERQSRTRRLAGNEKR